MNTVSRHVALQSLLTAIGLSGKGAEELTEKLIEYRSNRPTIRELEPRQRLITRMNCWFRVLCFLSSKPSRLRTRLSRFRAHKTRRNNQLIVQHATSDLRPTNVPDKCNHILLCRLANIVYGPDLHSHENLWSVLVEIWEASDRTMNLAVMSHRLKNGMSRGSEQDSRSITHESRPRLRLIGVSAA